MHNASFCSDSGIIFEDGVPQLSRRLIAGLSYLFLTTIGFTGYIIFIRALIQRYSYFSQFPFYLLVYQLAIGDIGLLTIQYLVTIPLSLSGRPLYGDGWLLISLSSFDTVFFIAIYFINVLITLNRFTAFLFPRLCDMLFRKPNVYFTILLPWIISIAFLVCTTFFGCPKTFDHTAFHFLYRCEQNLSDFERGIVDIHRNTSVIFPLLCLVLYVIVFIVLKLRAAGLHTNQHATNIRHQRERSLLLQAVIICAVFELECVGFQFFPDLAATELVSCYWSALGLTWLSIIVCFINPIVFYLFNPTVRRRVNEVWLCADKKKPVLPTVNVHTLTRRTYLRSLE